MRTTVTLNTPSTTNPLQDKGGLRNFRKAFRDLLAIAAVIGGEGFARRLQSRPSILVGLLPAVATIVPTAVAGADTVTVNGQALTATQHRATGTVTLATVSAADTFTLNGVVFTAVNGSPVGNQFDMSGTDTADAATLVTAINACTTTGVRGLIKARSAAGVVTVYAVTPGTAGNAFTLVSSNGGRLAVSAATMANGAAVANNQFDYVGTDITTGAALRDAINASTTAAVSQHVEAASKKVIVTCASVAAADFVNLNGTILTARVTATDSGGARIGTAKVNEWCMNSTDTNDAISLVNCINAHPLLSEKFFASNAAGVVTIYERPRQNSVDTPTIATSNATRLAVTGSLTAFAEAADVLIQSYARGYYGNALTVASSNGTRLPIGGSASRLAGGTATSKTF